MARKDAVGNTRAMTFAYAAMGQGQVQTLQAMFAADAATRRIISVVQSAFEEVLGPLYAAARRACTAGVPEHEPAVGPETLCRVGPDRRRHPRPDATPAARRVARAVAVRWVMTAAPSMVTGRPQHSPVLCCSGQYAGEECDGGGLVGVGAGGPVS
jgi:hypothetical protein